MISYVDNEKAMTLLQVRLDSPLLEASLYTYMHQMLNTGSRTASHVCTYIAEPIVDFKFAGLARSPLMRLQSARLVRIKTYIHVKAHNKNQNIILTKYPHTTQ